MTTVTQTSYASSAISSPAATFAASAIAAIVYVGVCGAAALYLADGGFEVLAATFIGAVFGATAKAGFDSRFERVASYSYAGMWIGIMLAGLLHEPLARLFELAGSVLA